MLLTCQYNSPVLRRNTRIQVILPTPAQEGEPVKQNLKVLYLLHGLHGDESSWVRYSNIERYANDAGIAVVMPSVGNSFYQDMVHGERYFTYMTRELPAYIQGLFPVSKKREDTFIAGLSMGGYGAYFLGLRCPEQYSAIASFSGALDVGFRVTPLPKMPNVPNVPAPFYAESCFGDMSKIAGSDRDVFYLFEQAKQKGLLPRLYQSCGTKDFLYIMNVKSRQYLTAQGAEITWHETEGMDHEWDFWDMEIRRALKWFLEEEG